MTSPPAGPYRVCLVCMGNICRSPMAEAVLCRQLAEAGLRDAVAVDSAGTGGWHEGDDADERARAVLTAHGYTLRHRARRFRADWFSRYDLVLALDGANMADLRRLAPDADTADRIRLLRSYDPASTGQLDGELGVPDPYYGDGDGFAHVLRLVEAACRGLVEELRGEVVHR
ncbi:MAG: low molecular weight protein-tyrosine-phosphatase [Actinomycetes bacterium]